MESPYFSLSNLLLFSMLLLPLVSSMSCPTEERSALLQFKESFKLASSSDPLSYSKVVSWTLHEDCCSWDGVDCDDDGHVTALDLSSSHLFGSIHSNSSLFKLKHLQRLSLAHNNFNYSPIPPELALLSSTLTHLDLSSSCFAGQVPPQISMLSRLVFLDLGSPSSSTSLLQLKRPAFTSLVQNLTKLEVLALSWVDIPSTVPNSLSNLSSLTKLYLRSCNLVGEFPSSVFLLPNIQYIDIRYNEELAGHLPQFNQSPLKLLKLGHTSFSGELPNSIQNLHSLTEFHVGECNFTGAISSSLGNLTNLTFLDLSYNRFRVGELSWLVHLTNLQTLYLDGINLSGEIPHCLASLPHLKVLSLESCHLTGQIPYWLQNLTQLTYLHLGFNSLQGPVQKSIFSKLVSLETLYLIANNLTGMLELGMFQQMRNLTSLSLSHNHLSVVDFNGTLANLDSLYLSYCNLSKFPNFLKHQKSLRRLSLASNNIQGQMPTWFCSTSKETLLYLDLSNNLLTGLDQCNAALSWVNLQVLNLHHNLLRGEIPSFLCNLRPLFDLDLGHNDLSGKLPSCLGNMSNLSLLTLSNNNLSGTIPQMCTNGASKLEGMDLSGNQFHGNIPRSLANCTMLRGLDVGWNQINDTFPYWMGKLDSLQLLILRSNQFHGPIPKSSASANNSEFPSLRIIDLSHNDFSGLLPFALFCKWKAMKKSDPVHLTYMEINRNYSTISYIHFSMTLANKGTELEYGKIPNELAAVDFSSNNFIGEIPKSIGNLNGLYVLNLAHNHLTGSIPSSLANLTVLESLDLSHNKLWGEIPQELAQLNFLAYLNVSHNNLSGQVPRGKQFDTFEDSSFAGNSGLCGDLLITKRCRGLAPPSSLPISIYSEHCEDVESSKTYWMVMLMGYISGLVVGIVIGNTIMARKPKWFVKMFGEKMIP